MTCTEFNKKWDKFIEKDKPGLSIENVNIIKYLDSKYSRYLKENVKFSIREIRQISDTLICDSLINYEKDTVIEFYIKRLVDDKTYRN